MISARSNISGVSVASRTSNKSIQSIVV